MTDPKCCSGNKVSARSSTRGDSRSTQTTCDVSVWSGSLEDHNLPMTWVPQGKYEPWWWYCWWFRNPAFTKRYGKRKHIALFTGFHICQVVVSDFFHQERKSLQDRVASGFGLVINDCQVSNVNQNPESWHEPWNIDWFVKESVFGLWNNPYMIIRNIIQ